MSLISIDTSTPCLFISAKKANGEVINCSFADGQDMSAELLAKIDDLYQQVLSLNPNDIITGLYTTLGPGSFTGLRVGISSLKGMVAALNVPLYGLSTLKTYALSLTQSIIFKDLNQDALIVPILDARKSRFYTQIFKCSGFNELVQLTEPLDISFENLAQCIIKFNPKNVYFVKGYGTSFDLPESAGLNIKYSSFDIMMLDNPASVLFSQNCDVLQDEQGPLYVREVDAVEYRHTPKSF